MERSQQPGFPAIPDLPAGVAYVAALQGTAQVDEGGGDFRPLSLKEILPLGSGLRFNTVGGDSVVELALGDGSLIVVGPNSVVGVLAIGDRGGGGESIVALEEGIAVGATLPDSATTLVLTSPTSTRSRRNCWRFIFNL
jgi:hypothetical protein